MTLLGRVPFLGRLARRYALRHRGQTVRAILGLLVATTVLATGLGMGESIAVSLERTALAQLGPIDIILSSQSPFDAQMADTLPQTAGLSYVSGAASLRVVGSAIHPAAQRAEAFATIRGVSEQEAETLGPLTGTARGCERDPTRAGCVVPEPGLGQVVLSQELAERLDAQVGDRIRLRIPDPGASDVESEFVRLVGASNAPASAGHTIQVREDALGLGAEITWTTPGPNVTLQAVGPNGIAFANSSTASPLRLVVEPPLATGTWTFVVTSDVPIVYAGGAGVAYLPASLATGAATLEAELVGIALDEGRAAITGRPSALIPLSDMQRALASRGLANIAYYRADGDPHRAVAALEAALPPANASDFDVRPEKANRIEDAEEAGAEITGFLLAMGGFTLLASGLLAFTLFSALVEERRAELGIARALGLTRGEVALAMTLEGALYAAAAALVGLALGLALLVGIFFGIEQLAPDGAPTFALHVSTGTLVLAFVLGTLIPLATIGFASLRFARLDPARAIRGIPDDPRSRRRLTLGFGIALLAVGLAASFDPVQRLLGAPVALAGVALLVVATRWRILAIVPAAAAVALLVWTLYTFDAFPDDSGELDPLTTLARGGLLALGLSALAVSTSRPYVALARRKLRGTYLAAKYLVARRRPAGLTMAMISLVVVIVTVMGTLFSLFSGTIPDEEAGYAVIGEAPVRLEGFPRPLPPALARDIEAAEFLPSHIEFRQANVTRDGRPIDMEAGARQFLGATASFAESNEYELFRRDARYASDREAWDAVVRGEAILFPDWALDANGIDSGDVLTIQTALMGPREYVVAGGVRSEFAFQTWLAADHVRAMGFPSSTRIFVRVAETADPDAVAHTLAATYTEDGISFTSIPEEVATVLQSVRALVLVFEGFLALGLFVGLAATGFLASRAVHERMRDIGTLRALGYEERDVRSAFMIESMLTSGIGLVIGTIVGLVVAHSIWWREIAESGASFRPPWLLIAGFSLAVLALAAFASRGPAKRAAALPPAIAVRYVE